MANVPQTSRWGVLGLLNPAQFAALRPQDYPLQTVHVLVTPDAPAVAYWSDGERWIYYAGFVETSPGIWGLLLPDGSIIDMSNTIPAGSDTVNDVVRTERQYTWFTITGPTAGQLIKDGAGHIGQLRVAGGTMGAVTLYDGTSTAGAVMQPAVTPVQGQILYEEVDFNAGLFVVLAAATTLTLTYR